MDELNKKIRMSLTTTKKRVDWTQFTHLLNYFNFKQSKTCYFNHNIIKLIVYAMYDNSERNLII